MSVVMESFKKSLSNVLVNEGVIRDFMGPVVILRFGGKFPVKEEIGHLKKVRFLGQLLDGIPAIAKDPIFAIKISD